MNNKTRCPHHNRAIIATMECLGEHVPLCCWLEMTREANPKSIYADLIKQEQRRQRREPKRA